MLRNPRRSRGTVASYAYVGGRAARRDYLNGARLDLTYDGIDGVGNPSGDYGVRRVIGTLHRIPGTPDTILDERSYTWDGVYNKTQRKDKRTGPIQRTFDYTYDALSRLTQSALAGGSTVTYTLDAAGNRTDTGYGLEGPEALLNQYTRIPNQWRGYDLQGNLSTFDARAEWYTYDVYDRLINYVVAGARTEDDFSGSLPPEYETPPAEGWIQVSSATACPVKTS